MPVNRRMLAADVELAQKLSELAKKHKTSLYSLTNRLIESFIHIESLGYSDPLEAAVDFMLVNSLLAVGFKLQPPQETQNWRELGETLWLLASARNPRLDPKTFLVRLVSMLVERKNVMIEASGETSILVAVPSDSSIRQEQLRGIIEGIARSALGDGNFALQEKTGILIVRIKESGQA